jgi:transaldolase
MKALSVLYIALFVSHIVAWTPTHRGRSRFFLDTARTEEWKELLPTGIFHGVTTNPTLLERAGEKCTVENVHKLADLALSLSNEFMCQAWGESIDEVLETGRALASKDRERIVIKVPVTQMGLEAAGILIQEDVRICLTACYSRKQALIAVGVGAEYLAPYLGRMTDAGKDGKEECVCMQEIVEGLQGGTRILVASIRDVETMSELASAGLDTYTFTPDVARQLLFDPLTKEAAANFEAAAKRNS